MMGYMQFIRICLLILPLVIVGAKIRKGETTHETSSCIGSCVWDHNIKITGNFSSLRSYPFRITGVQLYEPLVKVTNTSNRCCDMGTDWIRETVEDLKTGENRDNVYLYLHCDPGVFPGMRLNINLPDNVGQLRIAASTALNLINCGISFLDVAEITRITSVKLLFFDDVDFKYRAEDPRQMQKLFDGVSQIILNQVTPRKHEVLEFVEEYKFPAMHTLDIDGPPTNRISWENVTDAAPNLRFLRLIGGNMSTVPAIQYPTGSVNWTVLEAGMNANRVDFSKLVNPALYEQHQEIVDWLRKVEFQFSISKTTLLKTLDLRGNEISSIGSVRKNSNMEVFNLRQNRLQFLNSSIVQNLTELSALDVGQNYIQYIDKDTFKGFINHPEDVGLEMLHIDSSNLKSVDKINWYHLRNLKYLDISNNSIGNISSMLQKLPSLKMLISQDNNLTQVPYPKEYDIVMYLNLGNNEIVDFPRWIFGSLSLEYVNLANNRLTTKDTKDVPTSVFVPSLTSATKRVVQLSGNCIRHLPIETPEAARTLTEILGQFFLDFSNNPIHCGCEDLKDYLRDQGVGNLESIACSAATIEPSELCQQLYLDEYGINSTDEFYMIDTGQVEPYKCLWEKRRHLIVTSTVTAVSLALFFTVTFYALFSKSYDIQLAVWEKWRKRLCYRGHERAHDKYDAFVAYSSKDYTWVVHVLRKELEEQFGYKLFIHDRDFKPGIAIPDNIFEGLKYSKRIVTVITQNFLDSEWCTFEFRAAHKEEVMRGTNYVIAVVLQDIPRQEIPQDLNRYLTTKTYIRATDNWFWRKLTFAMPANPINEHRVQINADDLAEERKQRMERRRREEKEQRLREMQRNQQAMQELNQGDLDSSSDTSESQALVKVEVINEDTLPGRSTHTMSEELPQYTKDSSEV